MTVELQRADRIVIGIDPGLTGAIATINADTGRLNNVADMPAADGRVTAALLTPWLILRDVTTITAVGIELSTPMPHDGRIQAFKFGAAWGTVHGAFGGAGLRTIDVRPQAWKKTFHIGGPRDGQKEKARRLAIERWPTHADAFARKKDAGRAEAALIAEHTRQLLLAETATEQP